MALRKRHSSVSKDLILVGRYVSTRDPCHQTRSWQIKAASLPTRSYWNDGSNRPRGEYLRHFKRWADEDFAEYKRKQAAFDEEMDRRMAATWPKIRPWMSWAVSTEPSAQQSADGTNGGGRPERADRKAGRTEDSRGGTRTASGSSASSPNVENDPSGAAKPPDVPEVLFEYDPITMRRVIKSTSSSVSQKADGKASDEAVGIHVKPFIPRATRSSTSTAQHDAPQSNASITEPIAQQPNEIIAAARQPPSKPRIENALDRHLRNQERSDNSQYQQMSKRKPRPENSVDEHLDTLRASDIRSSPTLQKQSPVQVTKEDIASRHLDRKYQTHLRRIEALTADVRDPRQRSRQSDRISPSHAGDLHALSSKRESSRPSGSHSSANNAEAARQEAKRKLDEAKRRKDEAIRVAHAAEVDAQKMTMDNMESNPWMKPAPPEPSVPAASSPMGDIFPGEGDVATNVHEFAARDRWYKQRAPPPLRETVQEMARRQRDQQLVKSVRSIYEDVYGTITTNHRQVSPQSSKPIRVSECIASYATPAKGSGLPPSLKIISSHLVRSMIELRSAVSELYKEFPSPADSSVASGAYHGKPSVSASYGPSSKDIGTRASQTGKGGLGDDARGTVNKADAIYRTPSSLDSNPSKVTMTTSTGPADDSDSTTCRERQPPSEPRIGLYKILSFNSTTGEMSITVARADISESSERSISIPAALDQVSHPGHFVPFLADLGKDGWKIAGRKTPKNDQKAQDILFFWKVDQIPGEIEEGTSSVVVPKSVPRPDRQEKVLDSGRPEIGSITAKERLKRIPAALWPNPVDGTLSPTGFVNYESLRPGPPEAEAATETSKTDLETSTTYPIPLLKPDSSPPAKTVRREEPVFSGTYHSPPSSHTHHTRHRHWQAPTLPHGLPPFSRSRRAAKRAMMMQRQQEERQQEQQQEPHRNRKRSRGRGRVQRVFKRMMWCGVALVGAFYAVGLGISSCFWIAAMFGTGFGGGK